MFLLGILASVVGFILSRGLSVVDVGNELFNSFVAITGDAHQAKVAQDIFRQQLRYQRSLQIREDIRDVNKLMMESVQTHTMMGSIILGVCFTMSIEGMPPFEADRTMVALWLVFTCWSVTFTLIALWLALNFQMKISLGARERLLRRHRFAVPDDLVVGRMGGHNLVNQVAGFHNNVLNSINGLISSSSTAEDDSNEPVWPAKSHAKLTVIVEEPIRGTSNDHASVEFRQLDAEPLRKGLHAWLHPSGYGCVAQSVLDVPFFLLGETLIKSPWTCGPKGPNLKRFRVRGATTLYISAQCPPSSGSRLVEESAKNGEKQTMEGGSLRADMRKALWMEGPVPAWSAEELPLVTAGFHEKWRGESGFGEFRRVEGFSIFVNSSNLELPLYKVVLADPADSGQTFVDVELSWKFKIGCEALLVVFRQGQVHCREEEWPLAEFNEEMKKVMLLRQYSGLYLRQGLCCLILSTTAMFVGRLYVLLDIFPAWWFELGLSLVAFVPALATIGFLPVEMQRTEAALSMQAINKVPGYNSWFQSVYGSTPENTLQLGLSQTWQLQYDSERPDVASKERKKDMLAAGSGASGDIQTACFDETDILSPLSMPSPIPKRLTKTDVSAAPIGMLPPLEKGRKSEMSKIPSRGAFSIMDSTSDGSSFEVTRPTASLASGGDTGVARTSGTFQGQKNDLGAATIFEGAGRWCSQVVAAPSCGVVINQRKDTSQESSPQKILTRGEPSLDLPKHELVVSAPSNGKLVEEDQGIKQEKIRRSFRDEEDDEFDRCNSGHHRSDSWRAGDGQNQGAPIPARGALQRIASKCCRVCRPKTMTVSFWTRPLQVLFVSSVASVGVMPIWIRPQQRTSDPARHEMPAEANYADDLKPDVHIQDPASIAETAPLQWTAWKVQWPPLVQPTAAALHAAQRTLHVAGGSVLHNFRKFTTATEAPSVDYTLLPGPTRGLVDVGRAQLLAIGDYGVTLIRIPNGHSYDKNYTSLGLLSSAEAAGVGPILALPSALTPLAAAAALEVPTSTRTETNGSSTVALALFIATRGSGVFLCRVSDILTLTAESKNNASDNKRGLEVLTVLEPANVFLRDIRGLHACPPGVCAEEPVLWIALGAREIVAIGLTSGYMLASFKQPAVARIGTNAAPPLQESQEGDIVALGGNTTHLVAVLAASSGRRIVEVVSTPYPSLPASATTMR